MPTQYQEEDTYTQCWMRQGTHHSRSFNESVTQNPSRWFWSREGIDPSATTKERELGNGLNRYLEKTATTATTDRMTVQGNGINIGLNR